MKCVHTLRTGRHKRQADITLLFQFICFGYHKYAHLFWSTDKLGIYHVYRKYTVFCLQNIVIEKLLLNLVLTFM